MKEGFMRWRDVLIAIICVGLSASAFAEFYQYTDGNGVLRFTDNYMDIPVQQRKIVKRFTDPDDFLTPEQIAAREQIRKEREGKTSAEIQAAKRLQLRDSLNQSKAELDKTHAQLSAEQKALEKEKETVSMSDYYRAKAYRDKVIDFNRRLAEYQKRLKIFNKEAKAFNGEERAVEKIKR